MTAVVASPSITATDALKALRDSGYAVQEWGRAVDGTPLLAARAGGNKQPAIVITAGAHSTETAGVHSALHLLQTLETEHEVHVLPLRDPMGFGGVSHCLSVAAGQAVQVATHQAALDYLLAHGQVIWQEDDLHLVLLGDLGFLWTPPTERGVPRFVNALSRMLTLSKDTPDILRPLWGRRVLMLVTMPDVEGTGEMGRCWQGVLSGQGEFMHLNRFFGRDDAPAEVQAVERLLQAVRPGLICDLHEGNGSGFWLPVPRPAQPELVLAMGKAMFQYFEERGYPVTTYEEWLATDETAGKNYTLDWMRPEPDCPGLFWCFGLLRGEGYNLIDYATLFGTGFGTEAPMERPLAMRVDGISHGTLAAIRVWEQAQ
jgi:hypothetical protein